MKKGYEKYKDSGVNWIDEIPNSWAVRKLKHIANITGGSTPESENTKYWDGDIPWVTPVDLSSVTNHLILDTKRKITKEGLDSCGTTLVPKDSIILSTRAPIGSIAVAGVELCTNQGCKAITTKVGNPFFYYYQLLIWKEVLESFGAGATFKELPSSELKDFWITEPSFEEQEVIVNYLDRKTSQIDHLISEKEKLITLLQEKRQAVINEAVTRGLNKNVKLKDSGIEWLGKIPAHWEVKKLKYSVDLINEEIESSEFRIAVENIEGGSGKIVLGESKDNAEYEGALRKFQKGDVLFNKLRPYLNKVYIADRDGGYYGELLNFRPKRELTSDFLFYRLLSNAFIDVVNSSTYGTKMPRASWEDFISHLGIAIPPTTEEQNSIADFLNKNFNRTNETISAIRNTIEKLHEYRQSLISEMVTGKVDVREENL